MVRTTVLTRSHSDTTDKAKIISLALRKVFKFRIQEILQLQRGVKTENQMFRVTGSDCSCVEIEQNERELQQFICCADDIHKWVKDIPVTTTKAFVLLDEQYNCKLSRSPAKGQQNAWARHEGDTFRLVWSYFLRLCKRSRWSNNFVVLNLKTRYFSRHGKSRTESQDESEVAIVPYPDTAETQIMPYCSDVEDDDNSDKEEYVSIASPVPAPEPPVWSMVPCTPASSATGASCSAATSQDLAASLASAGAEDAAASTDEANTPPRARSRLYTCPAHGESPREECRYCQK